MPRIVILSYAMPNGAVGAFAVDASVNEQHVTTAQVTQHQVETGSPVTDFIRALPSKLTLEAMVTNTPIQIPVLLQQGSMFTQVGFQAPTDTPQQVTIGGQVINFKTGRFSPEFDRVKDFYGGIVTAALGGAIWSVYTTLWSYSNMAIVNFAVPRNVGSSSSIQGAIDLQQLRFAATSTAPVSMRVKQRRGQKSPTQVTDPKPAQKVSTASALLTNLFGGG